MGSALRLSVVATDDAVGDGRVDAAWAEVVDEFEQSDRAMSRFRETSELTTLNRVAGTGRVVEVSRRLERALVAADRARRVTGGRFDPRVLADLDRLGYRGAALPSTGAGAKGGAGSVAPEGPRGLSAADRDERVFRRVGRGRLCVEHAIDLGGIGKGLALRWAADRLDHLGLPSYLLEAGGDLVAHGGGTDGSGWAIGIEDPSGAEPPLAVISVRDLAVTTSSIGVHAWIADGRPVHHLLDPVTGEPGGDGLRAVTVAGRDPAWAEVWSKRLFLAGGDGLAELARGRGLAAWWVDADGRLEMTPAARVRTVWVAAEA